MNGIYAPSVSPKWTRRLIAQMDIAPADLADRFDALLVTGARDSVRDAGRLIDETLTLVERHVPTIDTRPVRSRVVETPRTRHKGS